MTPIISVYPEVTFFVLLVILKTALFLMNFNLIMLVVCSFMSKILTTAIPDSISKKELLSQPSFKFFRQFLLMLLGKMGLIC